MNPDSLNRLQTVILLLLVGAVVAMAMREDDLERKARAEVATAERETAALQCEVHALNEDRAEAWKLVAELRSTLAAITYEEGEPTR